MKAMILAAGFGSRLQPLTNSTPKPLLPLGGRPLIEWNLLLLRRHGVRRVLVNLHHLGEQLARTLGDGSRLGMQVTYSHEPELLGTGGGIRRALPFFSGEPFFVLNGDTVLEVDLDAVAAHHAAQGAVATMVVREDPDVERWGPVEVDVQHAVLRVNGRGRAARPAHTFMFAGVHIMDGRLVEPFAENQPFSIVEAYVQALEQGARIASYLMKGYWSDIGTPARYEQARLDVEAGRVRLADRARDVRGVGDQ